MPNGNRKKSEKCQNHLCMGIDTLTPISSHGCHGELKKNCREISPVSGVRRGGGELSLTNAPFCCGPRFEQIILHSSANKVLYTATYVFVRLNRSRRRPYGSYSFICFRGGCTSNPSVGVRAQRTRKKTVEKKKQFASRMFTISCCFSAFERKMAHTTKSL